MENLPRNLEKELNALKLPQPSKRKSLWSLYFVSDDGEILTINRFRAAALIVIILLIIAVACCGLLYWLYYNTRLENTRLVKETETLENHITKLETDNENLNARVGIAEAKLSQFGIGPKPESKNDIAKKNETIKSKPEEIKTASVKPAEKPKEQNVKKENTVKPVESDVSTQNPVKSGDQVAKDLASFPVSIEDVSTVYIQITEMLKIKFTIKKNSDDSQTLSGYTFVIFKPENDTQKDWFVIPSVEFKDGAPENIEKGQSFSISRFKTVSFRAKGVKQPERFKQVSVLVYSKTGDIIYDHSFPVNID